MAQTIKRKTAKGEARYDVRYRTPAGEVRTKTFRRAEDARNFITGVEADKLEGRYVDPRASRMTVGAWWDEWWPTVPNLRPTTVARDETYFRKHIRPTFGAVALSSVDHQAVARWVASLTAKGLAPATVVKAHQILAKTLRAAVKAGKLPANPADDVPLPRIEPEEMRFLEPAQVLTLADTIDYGYRSFVLLGAYGGLRLGELLGLRWSRVDLLRRHVDVAEIQTEVHARLAYGPPKTRASRRRVPLPRIAADALEDHRPANYDPDALVFTSPDGAPIRANNFRRRIWTPATITAELAVKDDPRPLRIHDLRHTAVALWIAAGATPKEVATRAGHTSVAVVLDRYGHLLPGHADRLNDALDAMAEAVTEPGTVTKLRTA